MTYEILQVDGHQAIKCLRCNSVSHNPNDVEHRYCGQCHIFHDFAFDLDQLLAMPRPKFYELQPLVNLVPEEDLSFGANINLLSGEL